MRGAHAASFHRTSSAVGASPPTSFAVSTSVDELIVELGAGDGRLTAELARRARRVVAIEVDPRLAGKLRRRFEVVEGDALAVRLPSEPFRVVGNIPFHRTTAILRHLLDDLGLPLERADLIVQLEVARKRTSVVPRRRNSVRDGSRGGS